MLEYSVHDRQKLGKSRTPKSKHRQSPYTTACDPRDYSSELENGFKTDFDIGVPLQGFQGIQYSSPLLTSAHAQDTLVERYNALYSSYANPITAAHSLKDCAYSGSISQPHFDSGQFRVSAEDRFSARESDFLQMNSVSQSEPKLDETIQLTPLSREIRSNGGCSRSSSRGEGFVPALPLHETHSNRSESSASDVDVISDDLDAGKSENKQCSKVSKEAIQQSVIMRMPNQNQPLSQSPRYSCDYSKSNMSKSPRSAHTDVVKYPSEQGNSPNGNFFVGDTEKPYDGIKHVHSKSYGEGPILQCLRNNYSYDSYSPGSLYPTSGIQGKPYTVMPQAGYTSVIVDAQQYQMANGFVH